MLGKDSSRLQHAWQNLALLLLSAALLPFSTLLLLSSLVVRPFLWDSPDVKRKLLNSPKTSSVQSKTILVTGVGMTKGLTIARSFYAAGHHVIGADFEGALSPTTCGRYSRSLKAFYKLSKPDGSMDGSARYTQSLLEVIRREKVDLWVSCSGVASALDDGRAKETIELVTSCKAVQYDVAMTQKLHEKHHFMDFTKSIGLPVPQSHHITSHDQALDILTKSAMTETKYIMKFTGTDDAVRGDMTLLPFASPQKTKAHIMQLPISKDRPWILQQYIDGPEYCTHAVVINNEVVVFTACPSAELLMHYVALDPESVLSQSMLRFTRNFAAACPAGFTGHLSFDFMVQKADAETAMRGKIERVPLWPIECNPRAHTAVVLFSKTPEMVSKGYMKIFDQQTEDQEDGGAEEAPVYPSDPAKYYWLPHDFTTLVVQPIIGLLLGTNDTLAVQKSLAVFTEHLVSWHDGTFEIWDPLPAWVLWQVSWPWIFFSALVSGRKWSRINVSTMKVFGC